LFGIIFDTENRGDMFVRNVGWLNTLQGSYLLRNSSGYDKEKLETIQQKREIQCLQDLIVQDIAKNNHS
jgi:hypothetical protein